MRLGAEQALLLRAVLLLLFLLAENNTSAGGFTEFWTRGHRPQTTCSEGGEAEFEGGPLLPGFDSSLSDGFGFSNSSALGVCPVVAASTWSAGAGAGESSEQENLEFGPIRVVGEVGDEFIVRFREFKHASEHEERLKGFLDEYGWQWVTRVNPAAVLPTDFGLLRMNEDKKVKILHQLANADFVKDVCPQMQFTRSLASETVSGEPDDVSLHRRQVLTDGEGQLSGRYSTHMSFDDHLEMEGGNISSVHRSRQLLSQKSKLTSIFGAEKLWAMGYTGAKVKMAVFDTGVRADHPHFRNIMERTDWTNDGNLNDNLGHGTFVAGVISSQDPQCLGFAPDVEIYAFRVFTDEQVSYTSWFLDAFNYAIAMAMNVLNLSIGGPDYLDRPFVEKVWEMTANKIIMVSAIGNDGPFYGTLNNPADQSDVIGVGGIDYSDHIAVFSSRGMTTWELPHGYGRVKPDVVAYGREVIGSKITSGCKSLSGTSVASPVVAGAVCLLASVIPEHIRWDILNPASMKQALVEGATRLDGPNMFEQGAGRLNLLASYDVLVNYKPRASVFPSRLDFTDCPYAWPFCYQPMYAGAMPVIFNATILNGMAVAGYIEERPSWVPSGDAGNLLDIDFTYSDYIWPWTGYLGLHFRIKPEGSNFQGIIEGNVIFTVVSPPGKAEKLVHKSDCVLPIKLEVIPTPPREKRILWDQFHSIRYPPGYIPRDSLDVRNDILDWHGDHLHTNFHGMFDNLRDAGYYVEILGSPFTCFDAKQYGTLLLVDLEDEYYQEEIEKLKDDVRHRGLGVVVFADWYHVDTMVKMRFFDDNTRSWWTPATGGANIPALNDLLAPFGIAFGDTILNGPYSIGGERIHYASGTDIVRFPAGGFVHRFLFQDSFSASSGITSARTAVRPQVEVPILGATQVGKGRVTVYGDSNCLDSSHNLSNCYWLLQKLLNFTNQNVRDPVIFAAANELINPLGGPDTVLPVRRDDVNLTSYSLVLVNNLQCGPDSPFEVQGTQGYVNKLGKQPKNRSIAEDVQHPGAGGKHIPPRVGSEGPPGKEIETIISSDEKEEEHPGNVSIRRATPEEQEIKIVKFPLRDEPNLQLDRNLVAVQWLVPVLLCLAGLLILVMSVWRVRQRKRRRSRKASSRGLLP